MKSLFRIASSWWTTTLLLLVLAGTYVRLSFGQNPYPLWLDFLGGTVMGIMVLMALMINLILINIRIVLTGLSRKSPRAADIRAMDSWMVLPLPSGDAAGFSTWMRQKGYRPKASGDAVSAVRGRLSFLPGVIFRTGIIVLGAALFATASVRESIVLNLHEHEEVEAFGSTLALRTITADLPEDFLKVGENESFLLTDASASVTVDGKHYEVTSGFATRVNGLSVVLSHLGYSTVLTVGDSPGISQRVDLDLLPPGRTAAGSIEEHDIILTFSLSPERTITKGLLTGRQYNLASPRYRVVFQTGPKKEHAGEITLRPGESSTAGPLPISLGSDSRFVRLHVVRDPAFPAVYAGLLMTLTGLCLLSSRFFWYRRELAAVQEGSMLLIGHREEFYKKWGILAFEDWRDELLQDGEPAVGKPDSPDAEKDAADKGPEGPGVMADHDQR